MKQEEVGPEVPDKMKGTEWYRGLSSAGMASGRARVSVTVPPCSRAEYRSRGQSIGYHRTDAEHCSGSNSVHR